MRNDVKVIIAKMYEYVVDAIEICKEYDNDYDKALSIKKNRLAITMCLAQIGELANRVKERDLDIYHKFKFEEPKGMRDRIVHGYGQIDFNIIKDTLKDDIPSLKKLIEDNIEQVYLDNPNLLYDAGIGDK